MFDSSTTPMKSSCGGNMCDMTHSDVWHDSFVCASWPIHVWHDSFICVTWLIRVGHDSFICLTPQQLRWNPRVVVICVTWHTQMCDMTHSYVCHDPFIRAMWPVDTCDRTHWYLWHDSLICVTWLMHMSKTWTTSVKSSCCGNVCDMSHSYVWHDSFVCVSRPIHMCDMTHSYVWHDSLICVTWLTHMCETLTTPMKFSCGGNIGGYVHTCGMTHSYVWQSNYSDEILVWW